MDLPEEIEELILDDLTDDILPEKRKILKTWLNESSENQALYTEYYTIWLRGKIAERKNKFEDEALWRKIKQLHLRRQYLHAFYRTATIAACILLFLSGYYFLNRPENVKVEVQTVTDLLAKRETKAVKLILSSGREVELRKQLTEQEVGACIRSDSTGLVYLDLEQPDILGETAYNELIVPKCGEYRLTLTDGTKITINSESQLRYPVKFTQNIREVWLTGEAYFEVVPDKESPFVVHLEHTSVKVLGTSFNVMAYREEKCTEITLVEGRVDVNVAGRHELLMPGNQMLVDNSTLYMESRKVDVGQYIAWKDGILRFDDLSLEQLMERLSRWYDIQFEFRQEGLKEKLFTGGFKKYENIARVLEMIQETNDVKFKVQDNKVIIEQK